MNITIKNLKHSEFASHETFCFEATVYVDGKRSFIASNDGRGGCTDFHPLKAGDTGLAALINKVNKALPDDTDLELHIFNLVADALTAKDLKKALKKITVLTVNGQVATYPAKHKPTPENLATVAGHKDVKTVLNALPFDEALKIFKEVA